MWSPPVTCHRVRVALGKGTMVSACTSPRTQLSCPCPCSPEAAQSGPSLTVSHDFQAAVPSLDLRKSAGESVLSPSRGTPGTPVALHVARMLSPLILTVRCDGDASSWHWCPRRGSQRWGWDPSLLRGQTLKLRYPCQLFIATLWVRHCPFHIPVLPTSLTVASSICP